MISRPDMAPNVGASTLTVVQPLAVGAGSAGRLVGISARTWRRLDAAGQVPAAVRIGGQKRWIVAELAAWLDSGCPGRAAWAMRQRVGCTE